MASEQITDSLKTAGIEYVLTEYNGFCTYNGTENILAEIHENNCDVIIGVGGGKIMDLSKLCGDIGKLPVITVPTSMATCAAYTTLSVVYDESGRTVGKYYIDNEVAAVFTDNKIMANQPLRLAASGIMDALAKFIEIKNGHSEIQDDNFDIALMTAGTLADFTYRKILQYREDACNSIKTKKYSDAVKNMGFLFIPVTGMISGISKGFGQSAIGHELYYQLRTYFTKETLNYIHGEIVAIGLLAQLCYNGTEHLIDEFKQIMQSMNMPVTLNEIGVKATDENFELLYANMLKSPFVENTPENEELFRKSLEIISPLSLLT